MDLNMFDFRFFRNSIAGVLNALNRNLYVTQIIDGKPIKYELPIYYEFGNDPQFIRDFFYELPNWCKIPEHSEGMNIKRPYGIIELNSVNIKTNEVSSRFSRADFENIVIDDISGVKKREMLSAYVLTVPLDLTFDLKIKTDNFFQNLTALESVINSLYKNTMNYFTYLNLRIPLNIVIGDNNNMKHKVPLNYKDNKERELPISLNVETYLPVFDDLREGSLQYKGDNIKDFYNRILNESNENIIDVKTYLNNGKFLGEVNKNNDNVFNIINLVGDVSMMIKDLIEINDNTCIIIDSDNKPMQCNVNNIYYENGITCIKMDDTIPNDAHMIIFKKTI